MPKRDRYDQGVPSWAELASSDLDGAKRFYSALFGWDCQDRETETGPYSLAFQRGEPAAGIYQTQGDMTSVWNTSHHRASPPSHRSPIARCSLFPPHVTDGITHQ